MDQCPQRYSPCLSACLQLGTGGPFTSKGDRTQSSGNYGHQGTTDEELEALCFSTGFEPVFTSITWESLFISLHQVSFKENDRNHISQNLRESCTAQERGPLT